MPLILRGGVALLLLAALAPWPYGYYKLLRWLVCSVASFLAFRFTESGRVGHAWTWGAIAVLFNPLIPVHLDRTTWNVADITVAVVLLALGGVDDGSVDAQAERGGDSEEPD